MDVEQRTIERNRYERHAPPITTGEAIRATLLNRVSWSAVFAGVVMAFAVQMILNLIGISVGAATVEGGTEATGVTLGVAIWAGITGIIAAFIGGYTAGRLAGEPERSTAGWHGLISWAASILVIALLMTTAAGTLVAGPVQMMGGLGTGAEAGAGAGAGAGATGGAATAIDSGAMAVAAIASAIALILGALAAWFGGCAGTVKMENLRGENGRSNVVH